MRESYDFFFFFFRLFFKEFYRQGESKDPEIGKWLVSSWRSVWLLWNERGIVNRNEIGEEP